MNNLYHLTRVSNLYHDGNNGLISKWKEVPSLIEFVNEMTIAMDVAKENGINRVVFDLELLTNGRHEHSINCLEIEFNTLGVENSLATSESTEKSRLRCVYR